MGVPGKKIVLVESVSLLQVHSPSSPVLQFPIPPLNLVPEDEYTNSNKGLRYPGPNWTEVHQISKCKEECHNCCNNANNHDDHNLGEYAKIGPGEDME